MKRAVLRVLLIGFSVVMLSSLLLACSKGPETSTPVQSSTITTSNQQPGGPGGGQTSTVTSKPAGSTTTSQVTSPTGTGPGGIPTIGDLKSLPSYRLTIMNKIVEGMGAGMVTYMKFEWVGDQKAEHAWMENADGTKQELYIRIGDKEWILLPGRGWVEQPPQTTTAAPPIPSDLAAQLKQAKDSSFNKLGTETVNNVKCDKYDFEYDMTIETPNLATGGTIETDVHCKGTIWIAAQGDLPDVVIKSVSTSEMVSAGATTVMESAQDLTDIGGNITISPPEGAGMPTLPPLPPGLTTSMTTTTTPPPEETTITTTTTVTTTPASGETPTFKDDFQGELKSDWVVTDPNEDATISLTARPGYLRLSVPDGNDLANATNYDAPRLLVPQTGDFVIDTALEFDPQLHYQGAGLLVWESERNFLRLEFGYGGLGGEAKNVVLCKQQDYELLLGSSSDVPNIAKQLELRLERQGDRFYASYRLQGHAWVDMGFTDLPMDSNVQVGIMQVSQYNTYELSADFDYFELYAR